jgi:hypothetical protein
LKKYQFFISIIAFPFAALTFTPLLLPFPLPLRAKGAKGIKGVKKVKRVKGTTSTTS